MGLMDAFKDGLAHLKKDTKPLVDKAAPLVDKAAGENLRKKDK